MQRSSPNMVDDAAGAEAAADPKAIEYVRVLSAYRKQCEATGQYDEAQRAHQKLQEIVAEEEERRRETLLVHQAKEKAELAAAHRQQLHDFVREWDAFLADADAEARAAVEAAVERHARELAALQAERRREREEVVVAPTSTTTAPPRVRWSPELLELRRKEALLRRQRQYGEAGRVRRMADRVEARELGAARREREAAWERREEKLKGQHGVELRVLQERAAGKRLGYVRQREADCRRLKQRNRNLMALLEERHGQQRARAASAVRRALEAAVHAGEEGVTGPQGGEVGVARASGTAAALASAAAAVVVVSKDPPAQGGGKRSSFPRVEERVVGVGGPPGG